RARGAFEAALDAGQQLLHADRLFGEVERADLGRLDGSVDGGVTGHHDDRHVELAGGRPFLEQGDAVGIGHPDVEQDQIGPLYLARDARFGGVFGDDDIVSFVAQDFREQLAYADFVINYKNVCHITTYPRLRGKAIRCTEAAWFVRILSGAAPMRFIARTFFLVSPDARNIKLQPGALAYMKSAALLHWGKAQLAGFRAAFLSYRSCRRADGW